MIFAAIFTVILLAIISWNATIYWYLRKYIMQDDSFHHKMIHIFIAGNCVFVLAAIIMLAAIPWSSATAGLFSLIAVQLNGFLK
jgi:hypothetical protein